MRILGWFLWMIGLLLLLALGSWQVQRHFWKQGLIADVTARSAQASVRLIGHPPEFTPVHITGTLDIDKTLFVRSLKTHSSGTARSGFALLMPLQQHAHEQDLWINVGFLPAPLTDSAPSVHDLNIPTSLVSIKGWMRAPESEHFWTPKPQGNVLYALTPPSPFYIEAAQVDPPIPTLETNSLTLNLSTNHKGYAFTWFGLALGYVGITWLAFRRKIRFHKGSTSP
jgi:surfeit locus 1 family protein